MFIPRKLLGAVFVAHLFTLTCLAVDPDRDPAWSEAYKAGPMKADETKAFMKQLAQYVFEHHMKKGESTAQRGMTYEYFHVARAGQVDQFIQGEALDTMHDGAWLAVA